MKDLDGVVTVDASIGDTTTATTAKVHTLPDGGVVCFEQRTGCRAAALSILQRTAYAAARTFDALLLRPEAKLKRDRALELRLIEKQHLSSVVKWGDTADTTVVCSPELLCPLSSCSEPLRAAAPARRWWTRLLETTPTVSPTAT